MTCDTTCARSCRMRITDIHARRAQRKDDAVVNILVNEHR